MKEIKLLPHEVVITREKIEVKDHISDFTRDGLASYDPIQRTDILLDDLPELGEWYVDRDRGIKAMVSSIQMQRPKAEDGDAPYVYTVDYLLQHMNAAERRG